ncbi:hypothetical protein ACJX0J_026014 [Zea mays]
MCMFPENNFAATALHTFLSIVDIWQTITGIKLHKNGIFSPQDDGKKCSLTLIVLSGRGQVIKETHQQIFDSLRIMDDDKMQDLSFHQLIIDKGFTLYFFESVRAIKPYISSTYY